MTITDTARTSSAAKDPKLSRHQTPKRSKASQQRAPPFPLWRRGQSERWWRRQLRPRPRLRRCHCRSFRRSRCRALRKERRQQQQHQGLTARSPSRRKLRRRREERRLQRCLLYICASILWIEWTGQSNTGTEVLHTTNKHRLTVVERQEERASIRPVRCRHRRRAAEGQERV